MRSIKGLLSLAVPTAAPMGLDIGASSVKLMQLEPVSRHLPGPPVVRAAARVARADDGGEIAPASLKGAIRELLSLAPFRGRRCVAAVPRYLLQVRAVRLPIEAIGSRDIERLARSEAAGLFPFDLADAHVECLPAGKVRQGAALRFEVIVLAAARREVDRHVAALHEANLIVDSLDPEPCALYRSAARFAIEPQSAIADVERDAGRHAGSEPALTAGESLSQRTIALVDVGVRRTEVVIGRGPQISFVKPIEVGARNLDQAVGRKLGVTAEEGRAVRRRAAAPEAIRQAVYDATRGPIDQIGRELALYLRYHAVSFRGERPRSIELVGGESANAQLRGAIAAATGLAVHATRSLAPVDARRMSLGDRDGCSGAWAVALGLALKKYPFPIAPTNPPRVPPGHGRLQDEPAPTEEAAHA